MAVVQVRQKAAPAELVVAALRRAEVLLGEQVSELSVILPRTEADQVNISNTGRQGEEILEEEEEEDEVIWADQEKGVLAWCPFEPFKRFFEEVATRVSTCMDHGDVAFPERGSSKIQRAIRS